MGPQPLDRGRDSLVGRLQAPHGLRRVLQESAAHLLHRNRPLIQGKVLVGLSVILVQVNPADPASEPFGAWSWSSFPVAPG